MAKKHSKIIEMKLQNIDSRVNCSGGSVVVVMVMVVMVKWLWCGGGCGGLVVVVVVIFGVVYGGGDIDDRGIDGVADAYAIYSESPI